MILRQEVAGQMYFLMRRFSGSSDIENRTSYKNLVIVVNQRRDVIESKNPLVIYSYTQEQTDNAVDFDKSTESSSTPENSEAEEFSREENREAETSIDTYNSNREQDSSRGDETGQIKLKTTTGGR